MNPLRAGGRTVVLFTDEQAAAVVRACTYMLAAAEQPVRAALTNDERTALLTVRQALSMTTEKEGPR